MIEEPTHNLIKTSATKAIYSAQTKLNPEDYSTSAVIAAAITVACTRPGLVKPAFAMDSNGMLPESRFHRAFDRKAIAILIKSIKLSHGVGTTSALDSLHAN